MNIVFIGSGNVATYYAVALHKKQHNILQIYSPTIANAQLLADKVNAAATNNINNIVPNADAYFIAVKDDVLQNISLPDNLQNAVLIHCSGTSSVQSLQKSSQHLGVIWTLYSIKKENATQLNNIPLITDNTTDIAQKTIAQLTKDISEYPAMQLSDEKRKIMHLNAVLVNNFTNHLLDIAAKISEENQLPFEMLYPIIEQTFTQIKDQSPAKLQTGPAIRGDNTTIQEHLEFLKSNKEWQEVYSAITESIRKG